ncbi:phosphoribosyltransferase [Candidatus Parcubacteria bacterium]|nr:MAG: phosphoribosyltransferase [Candidatus Parcubacteria bacterium]
MNQKEILEILSQVGGIITDSHIVYTSGKHGSAYINKDAVYPHVQLTSDLCRQIAEDLPSGMQIDVVAAPAVGGVILSTWLAYWLNIEFGHKAVSVYAEKSATGESFQFNRGYDKLIPGKRVLVVEDVLTTGGSAKKVIEAVRALDGKVVGLAVLCNRGNVTPPDVANPPMLFSLVNIQLEAWEPAICPMCRADVPINTQIGKGREFLAQQKSH